MVCIIAYSKRQCLHQAKSTGLIGLSTSSIHRFPEVHILLHSTHSDPSKASRFIQSTPPVQYTSAPSFHKSTEQTPMPVLSFLNPPTPLTSQTASPTKPSQTDTTIYPQKAGQFSPSLPSIFPTSNLVCN